MAYQVIARKWRPKVFGELIGQDHISQTLINALQQNRIPHALLLTGPRGTGKTSTARILAKSLRCPNSENFIPCNECSDCQDVNLSRHIDVIEIDGASNNGVDAIRELRETVGFMPTSGKYKVYIIDEVHMLTGSAFNALLKTLEEPPPHVVFIMATTEAQKIPNTVLSRCQRFDFRKISARLVADHLTEICKREKVNSEPQAIWAIARQGDGSMRDSQSLLDQVVSFCQGDLSLKKVTDVLGLTDRSLLIATIKALVQRDTKSVVKVANKIFDGGYDPGVFIKDLLEELRHLIFVKVSTNPSDSSIDLPEEEIVRLKELSQQLSEEDIHMLFDIALKGANDLYRAQDTQIVLEMLLLRMAKAPRIHELMASTSAAAPEPERASTKSDRPSSPKTPPQKTNPLTPTTSAASGLNERWTELVDRVRKVNGLVAAKLDQLHLTELKGKHLKIGVPEKFKFLAPKVKDTQFEKKLLNYVNTFWGQGHSLEIFIVDPGTTKSVSPVKLQEQKVQKKEEHLNKEVSEHPFVKQANTIFKTQIKSIRENQ